MSTADDSHAPPSAVRGRACRALKQRAKKPPSQRGMTPVGVARARDLCNGRPVSPATLRRMASFFARHAVDKSGSTWGEYGKGRQAWDGWGGDPGAAWAKRKLAQLAKASPMMAALMMAAALVQDRAVAKAALDVNAPGLGLAPMVRPAQPVGGRFSEEQLRAVSDEVTGGRPRAAEVLLAIGAWPWSGGEKLHGGEGDGRDPRSFDRPAPVEGALHELEHTDRVRVALEIAMDHLAEDPDYYGKLKAIEKGADVSDGATPAATAIEGEGALRAAVSAHRARTGAERRAGRLSALQRLLMRNPPDLEAPPVREGDEPPYEGALTWRGLRILIENKAGSTRSGVDPNGKPWSIRMQAHYGEIQGSLGTDGDPLDVYVGPHLDAPTVYVVHQKVPGTNVDDEDKALLGVDGLDQARARYLAHYNKPGFWGGCTRWPAAEFAAAVKAGHVHGKKLDGPAWVQKRLAKGRASGVLDLLSKGWDDDDIQPGPEAIRLAQLAQAVVDAQEVPPIHVTVRKVGERVELCARVGDVEDRATLSDGAGRLILEGTEPWGEPSFDEIAHQLPRTAASLWLDRRLQDALLDLGVERGSVLWWEARTAARNLPERRPIAKGISPGERQVIHVREHVRQTEHGPVTVSGHDVVRVVPEAETKETSSRPQPRTTTAEVTSGTPRPVAPARAAAPAPARPPGPVTLRQRQDAWAAALAPDRARVAHYTALVSTLLQRGSLPWRASVVRALGAQPELHQVELSPTGAHDQEAVRRVRGGLERLGLLYRIAVRRGNATHLLFSVPPVRDMESALDALGDDPVSEALSAGPAVGAEPTMRPLSMDADERSQRITDRVAQATQAIQARVPSARDDAFRQIVAGPPLLFKGALVALLKTAGVQLRLFGGASAAQTSSAAGAGGKAPKATRVANAASSASGPQREHVVHAHVARDAKTGAVHMVREHQATHHAAGNAAAPPPPVVHPSAAPPADDAVEGLPAHLPEAVRQSWAGTTFAHARDQHGARNSAAHRLVAHSQAAKHLHEQGEATAAASFKTAVAEVMDAARRAKPRAKHPEIDIGRITTGERGTETWSTAARHAEKHLGPEAVRAIAMKHFGEDALARYQVWGDAAQETANAYDEHRYDAQEAVFAAHRGKLRRMSMKSENALNAVHALRGRGFVAHVEQPEIQMDENRRLELVTDAPEHAPVHTWAAMGRGLRPPAAGSEEKYKAAVARDLRSRAEHIAVHGVGPHGMAEGASANTPFNATLTADRSGQQHYTFPSREVAEAALHHHDERAQHFRRVAAGFAARGNHRLAAPLQGEADVHARIAGDAQIQATRKEPPRRAARS